MLSKQEMFDRLYEHFVRNEAPRSILSNAWGEHCAYNGFGNTHCAIGLFIRDIPINQIHNTCKVSTLMDIYPAVKKRFEGHSVEYLHKMQGVLHDHLNDSRIHRHETYAKFAKFHGLTCPSYEE